MSTTVANLLVNIKGNAQSLVKSFDQADSRIGKFASVAKAGYAVAAAGAAAAAIAIRNGIKNYDVQAKAEASLLTALKGRIDVQERLLDSASDLQRQTLFGDEAIIEQQAYLATLNLTEQQIKDVLKASVDLASGTDLSLGSAVKNLAKSYSGLSGELGEAIPQIRTLTKEQLQAGGAIDVVSEAYRGQAAAAAAADITGTQVKNQIGDLSETIGKIFAPAVKAGQEQMSLFLSDIQGALTDDLINKISAGLVTAAKSMGILFENVKAGLGPLQGLFKFGQAAALLYEGEFSKAFEKSKEAVSDMAKPIRELLTINEDIDAITSTYTETLANLSSVQEANTQTTSTQTTATSKYASELERALKAAQDLGDFNPLDAASSGNGLIESGLANPFLPDQAPVPDQTAAVEELDILRQRQDALLGLADAYTFLKEPMTTYAEGLTTAESAGQALNSTTGLLGEAALAASNAMAQQASSGASSFKKLAGAAVAAAREIIGAEIRKGVAAAVAGALKTVPFPFNIALGAAAGAGAQGLFNGLLNSIKIPAFGDGGVVLGPTLALVGEKGPEAIVPLSGGSGSGLEVNVRGFLLGQSLGITNERYQNNILRTRGY